jgi:hypothetical protein
VIKRYKILKPIMLSFSLARDQSDVLHAKGYLDADDETIWFVRRARLSDGLPHHQQGREETISSVAMLEWWLRDGALEEINMDVGPRTEKQDAQALTVALREANAVISDKAAAVERLKLELATARAWFAEQQKLVVDQRAKINALEHDNTHGAKALGERLEAVMNERDKERAVVAELIRERNLLASEAAGLHRNHKLMADQLDGYDALKDAYKRVVDQLAKLATPAAAPPNQAPVPAEVHERGWQWRPTSDDTAFAPPFGTVRACLGCGCLVAGGPANCARCAGAMDGRLRRGGAD